MEKIIYRVLLAQAELSETEFNFQLHDYFPSEIEALALQTELKIQTIKPNLTHYNVE